MPKYVYIYIYYICSKIYIYYIIEIYMIYIYTYINIYYVAAGNFVVDVLCGVLFYIRREDVLKQRRHSLADVLLKSPLSDTSDPAGAPATHRFNINMASAMTHVGGDTLRTGAVFIAAVVSSTTSIKGSVCDAWAAILVTATIIFLVVPLMKEIIVNAKNHAVWQSSGGTGERESEVASSVAQAMSSEVNSHASNSQA